MSVFEATQQLVDCEKVLAALAGTEHDDEEFLLHDRTREAHFLTVGKPYEPKSRLVRDCRLDHGGAFVPAFLGLSSYNSLGGLGYIVKRVEAAGPDDLTNSRYSRFRLGEIKEYLTHDLLWLMEHYSLRERAASEVADQEKWVSQAKVLYGEFVARGRKMRITFECGVFTVSLLDPYRANVRGFGVFLENIQLGEVSVSAMAQEALLERKGQPHRGGIPGMMIVGTPRVIGGLFGLQSQFSELDVVVNASKKELKALFVVE